MRKFRYGIEMFECTSNDCPGWKLIPTVYGTCCSFNFHPLSKWSASVLNQAGKFGGMNILFSDSGQNMPPSGISIIISQPGSFITRFLDQDMFPLIPGYDNYFRLYLNLQDISPFFKHLPLKSRQCMLPVDGPPSAYFRSRCILICITEAIYRECGCHPYFMPIIKENSKIFRNCTIKDLLCFANRTSE